MATLRRHGAGTCMPLFGVSQSHHFSSLIFATMRVCKICQCQQQQQWYLLFSPLQDPDSIFFQDPFGCCCSSYCQLLPLMLIVALVSTLRSHTGWHWFSAHPGWRSNGKRRSAKLHKHKHVRDFFLWNASYEKAFCWSVHFGSVSVRKCSEASMRNLLQSCCLRRRQQGYIWNCWIFHILSLYLSFISFLLHVSSLAFPWRLVAGGRMCPMLRRS